MRLGIADHLGWAVAVTADAHYEVVDRRRLELIDPGLSAAPVHFDRGRSSDDELAAVIERVRASIRRRADEAFAQLETDLAEPIATVLLRSWPDDVPTDLATLRRPPHEARVDAIRYRQVLAEAAVERGWEVRTYEAKGIEARAAAELGERADEVLRGPRARLGPPWDKDHRTALAATIVA